MSDAVAVAAAVIRRDGRVLVTRRPPGSHLGGLWEFPGGKIEGGESPADALVREIQEELGVTVRAGSLVFEHRHVYAERAVHLRFFDCAIIHGEPRALGVAEWRWVRPSELEGLEFPAANRELIRILAASGGGSRGA